MSEVRSLQVWLHGSHLGTVQRLPNGGLRLRFAPAALDEHGVGSCPLSLSLPLTDRRVEGARLERFLDNLLPEGPVRAALEREHALRPGDTFGLLTHIGRECAGAVQLTPDDAPPGSGRLIPLSDRVVERMVAQLPTLDAPQGQTVSASLGGVQAKLLLTRTTDGWAWPADGAMSTHIIKPEPITDAVVPDLVRWEEWALRLARASGVPAARAELRDFDGRTAVVVERFDRVDGGRTHQEDFAQALGLPAGDKYESTTTAPQTRLQQVARLAGAQAVDPDAFALDLVRQVTFNLAVGNGDAHAKNYSLAISPTGTYAMSPLYDVAPVFLLNPRLEHFGHVLDGQVRLRHLTLGHLVREASRWGVPRREVHRIVAETAEQVRATLDARADERDDGVPGQVAARTSALLTTLDE